MTSAVPKTTMPTGVERSSHRPMTAATPTASANSTADTRLLLPGSISIAREIIESWAAQ